MADCPRSSNPPSDSYTFPMSAQPVNFHLNKLPSDQSMGAVSAMDHRFQGRSSITVSLLSPRSGNRAGTPKGYSETPRRTHEVLPAAEAAQPRDEGCFFDCCARSRHYEEDAPGEQALVYEKPIEVHELFPIVTPEMQISFNVAVEDTLCPSFMKSELCSFESTPRWYCNDYQTDYYGWSFPAPATEDLYAGQYYSHRQYCPMNNPDFYAGDYGGCEEWLAPPPAAPKPRNKKFTPQEDEKLKELVRLYGEGAWSKIAEKMEGRNRKQVRDRYNNFLKPAPSSHDFSPEEDTLILKLVAASGKKWGLIARQLKCRTPQQVKGRYYSKLKSVPLPEVLSDTSELKTRALSVESNCSPIIKNPEDGSNDSAAKAAKKDDEEIKKPAVVVSVEPKKVPVENGGKLVDQCVELLKEQHNKLKTALQTVVNIIQKIRNGQCEAIKP